jgi:CheY-like chemotaxis protein
MNLDLGILWIEDSYEEQEEQNLRRRVQGAGFLARIKNIPNSFGIEDLARNHQLYHEFDLILLDFKLKDEKGDDLAPRIRDLFPSTTILFYSGSATEDELRRIIAEKKVEGVYCSERGRFIERAGSLIDQTARSFDRLSGMRGLAMRVVAECDELMRTAMVLMCERDPKCADKLPELDRDVIAFLDGQKENYVSSCENGLDARLDTRAIDSAKLFKHFRRLVRVVTANPQDFGLNRDGSDALRELNQRSVNYIEQVLHKRNILGHVREEKEATGWVLKGNDDIRPSDFAELRKAFAVHIETFREMGSLMTNVDEATAS